HAAVSKRIVCRAAPTDVDLAEEQRRNAVVDVLEVVAPVGAARDAAVRAHVYGGFRIRTARTECDSVVVRMDGTRHVAEAHPAVCGSEKINQADIKATRVLWIHADCIVVATLETAQA